jgi:hypothetical protein
MPAALRARCPEIQREFETRRAEATQNLQQARQIATTVEQVLRVLRAEAGSDSLTRARVEAIRTLRPDVTRARQIYLNIVEQGFTPEQLIEQVEAVETQVNYNLNPSFDPRAIVGDNYADGKERGYGNPDVEGPDAAHGTHVAGIIAAERGNGTGIEGVAPAVRIMSVRTVPDGDERDKDVANAIRYAVDNGAHIINMSFGKSWSPEKELVDEAVRYADSKGVLLVHAAGNDGADTEREPSYPVRAYAAGGAPQRWLEIGASSWQAPDHLAADFSNYGRTVDVFAPGVDILSTTPGNQYESFDGTSMASPVTAGVAALIMAYYPSLSATEVRDIILQSATRYAQQPVVRPGSESERVPFGSLSITGAVVNAHAALQLAEQRSRR